MSGYPANQTCMELAFSVLLYICSARYMRKWLEGHLAPPRKSRFRGQVIHTVISLRDLQDA